MLLTCEDLSITCEVATLYFGDSVSLERFLYVVFLFLNFSPVVDLASFHFSSQIIIFPAKDSFIW